jgi:hypothetical protein
VEQHQRRSFTGLGNMDSDAVGLNEPMLDPLDGR